MKEHWMKTKVFISFFKVPTGTRKPGKWKKFFQSGNCKKLTESQRIKDEWGKSQGKVDQKIIFKIQKVITKIVVSRPLFDKN